MIPRFAITPFEEIFTHIPDDGSPQRTYAVARLIAYLTESMPDCVKKVRVPVDNEHAAYCLQNRGVEKWRLAALRPEDMAKPIVFVEFDDGSHLLVDGTHRYVKAWTYEIPELPAWIVPFALADQFTISGMESVTLDELLSRPSMLHLARQPRSE